MSRRDVKDYYSDEVQIIAAEYLRFDFEKGEIYWTKWRGGKAKAGSRAGCIHANPETGKRYRSVMINKNNSQEKDWMAFHMFIFPKKSNCAIGKILRLSAFN